MHLCCSNVYLGYLLPAWMLELFVLWNTFGFHKTLKMSYSETNTTANRCIINCRICHKTLCSPGQARDRDMKYFWITKPLLNSKLGDVFTLRSDASNLHWHHTLRKAKCHLISHLLCVESVGRQQLRDRAGKDGLVHQTPHGEKVGPHRIHRQCSLRAKSSEMNSSWTLGTFWISVSGSLLKVNQSLRGRREALDLWTWGSVCPDKVVVG